MTMTSLVEMARKNHKYSIRGRAGNDNTISYAVHKQSLKKEGSRQSLYRVCIRIGVNIWEEARLRYGDPMDFQMDFTDGEGCIFRVPDTEGKAYPTFYKSGGTKTKNFAGAITFNYVEGMPFIRSAEPLSNIEIETGKIFFEFTTKQMEVLTSTRLKGFFK